MDQPKKRFWIREPLSEEERASGGRYYTTADIENILQTFAPRSDLDQDEFARDLEIAAIWFVGTATAGKAPAPSTSQREWERCARKIEVLLADFDQMDTRKREDLKGAAEQLAQRFEALPDLAPDRIELPPVPGAEPSPLDYTMVWPVAEQIEKSLAALRWLHQCTTEAASRAENEKAEPGNRPIEPKHFFYLTVIGIYEEAAEYPQDSQKDRRKGTLSREAFDMLHACLKPLGIPDSKSVIYETYYRACKFDQEIAPPTLRDQATA